MSITSREGPMILLEVLAVHRRISNGSSLELFVIRSKGWLLTITSFHAFVVVRDGQKTAVCGDQLRAGDRLWIDAHAYRMDGSLVRDNRRSA